MDALIEYAFGHSNPLVQALIIAVVLAVIVVTARGREGRADLSMQIKARETAEMRSTRYMAALCIHYARERDLWHVINNDRQAFVLWCGKYKIDAPDFATRPMPEPEHVSELDDPPLRG